MIAHLGMYDMPGIKDVTDRYWSEIRQSLPDAPAVLTRGIDPWHVWQSPDLLLSQTCGLPFRARLHELVTLVGTPIYDVPDCPPGHYFSVLIRRANDRRSLAELSSGTMAYNEDLSQSGWAAPLAHLRRRGLSLKSIHKTGGHFNSVKSVAREEADFAAIDVVSWRILEHLHPELTTRLDGFDRTDATPALPYITARGNDPEPIANAVSGAISRLSDADRHALMLTGFTYLSASDYLAIPLPPAPSPFGHHPTSI